MTSPPEAGVGVLLPEPAVLHVFEVSPVYVAVYEEDVSAGWPGACFEVVRSVVDVPAGPAAASCLGEVGRLAVRAVAGGYVGDEFDVGRGAFGGGDGSDPFPGRAAVGAHWRIRSAALRVDEPEVAHDAVHVSAVFFGCRLTRRVALGRAGREVLAVTPEDDVVSFLPGGAVEDMPVEAARLQNDVRRPV